jgi:hypothetical protein
MRHASLLLAAFLSACTLQARAGNLADVEIYDRTAGYVLPLYHHQGRLYVPGEPHHEYELRIRNHSGGRLLAVGSVDGVNVLSGQTASPAQGGYVLAPWDSVDIAGWRKSLSNVAAFYFTELSDSYAARTGRPENVGVIGVALFRERVNNPVPLSRQDAAPPPPAPMAEPAPAPDLGSINEESRAAAKSITPPAQAQLQSQLGAAADSARLGTGHGRIEYSAAYETSFQRNSDTPDEIISIWYDSRSRLVAQGVIPEPRRYAQRLPQPFPTGFVPDP